MPDWSRKSSFPVHGWIMIVIGSRVTNHAVHKTDEAPECYGVILHDRIYRASRSLMPWT
jgi:hypothetical protein